MKTDRYLWIVLPVILSWIGVRILLDSVRHPGNYADELILVGGTLSALGLVLLSVPLKQHLQIRALARHMKLGRSTSRRIEAKDRADGQIVTLEVSNEHERI